MKPTLEQLETVAKSASNITREAYKIYKDVKELWLKTGVAERIAWIAYRDAVDRSEQ